MSESNQHSELREKLRARAETCRMVGFTEWDNLPSRTREALYGIAAELDAVDGLFEQLEALRKAAEDHLDVCSRAAGVQSPLRQALYPAREPEER